MASTRTGLSSSSYSIVTWVLPSGRRYGSVPSLRTAVSCSASRWAIVIGSGISSGVSSQAKPNIRPWSPAPWRSSGSTEPSRRAPRRGVDALGDVGRLGVERDLHGAGLAVEALDRGVVADLQHAVAGDAGDVDVRLGGDLTADEHHARGDERLAGDPALRVVGQQGVEDAVADLVGNLVRVTLGHGLGREEAAHSSSPGSESVPTDLPAGQHWDARQSRRNVRMLVQRSAYRTPRFATRPARRRRPTPRGPARSSGRARRA